jgi:hypothetical protein
MRCKKCDGIVYIDTMYDNDGFIDTACFMCGKRWHIKKASALGRFLLGWRTKGSSLTKTSIE